MRYKRLSRNVAPIAIICLLSSTTIASKAESLPKVVVNDKLLNADAKIIDDRIYIPLRAVSESMGAQVNWDQSTNTASVFLKNNDRLIPEILEKLSPAVVGIIGNLKEEPYFAYDTKSSNQIIHGTGVIVKSNGEILTNAHVVKDMDRIIVVLSDGTGYEAELKCIDESSDLATIKISKTGLPVADFADQEDIIIGKTVIAIGTPISFSLRNSASIGIVSGINRSINSSYGLIQTDAAINPGNSGGPLVNLQGKVIGINSSKFAGTGIEGMGFSIPVGTIKYVMNQFDQYQKVRRPYLGVNFEEGWVARAGLPSNEGLTITKVKENSPAAKQGLLQGDILISINDEKVNTIVDYNEEMKKYMPQDQVRFKIKREGIIQNISIILGEEE